MSQNIGVKSGAFVGAHQRPRGVFSWLSLALKVRGERRNIATLDEAALRDLGISRSEADWEASRPFWDLPERR